MFYLNTRTGFKLFHIHAALQQPISCLFFLMNEVLKSEGKKKEARNHLYKVNILLLTNTISLHLSATVNK